MLAHCDQTGQSGTVDLGGELAVSTPNRVIELPQRSARVSDDEATEIVRLDIRRHS
jgi:hypothetical protein